MGMKNLKRISWKQMPNILFLTVIIVFLLLGFVRTVWLPKDINYYENRYSEKIIVPSLTNVLDGTFQNSVENALADQIPKAQTLKKAYNIVHGGFVDTVLHSFIQSNNDIYINYKGARLYNGYMAHYVRDFDADQPCFDAKAENYNAIIRAYPELEFYAYFIEKDTNVSFDTGLQTPSAEYMLSILELDEDHKAIYEVNNFADYAANFYHTDHHWNHRGSYKGYLQVMELLKCQDSRVLPGEEILIFDGYLGSKAAASGTSLFAEKFYGYKYDLPEFSVLENGVARDHYGNQEVCQKDQNLQSISYGHYYGYDSGEIIFTSGREDSENILVIGDSFDNAILQLMATHYNQLFSIDLRNYEAQMGQTFDFRRYVKEHDITKVLFIGNDVFYVDDDFLLENA